MEMADVSVKNKMGLHARPIAKLVKTSTELHSAITLHSKGRTAKISNIYELMALGLKCGDPVRICAEGENAAEELAHVCALFETSFGEE